MLKMKRALSSISRSSSWCSRAIYIYVKRISMVETMTNIIVNAKMSVFTKSVASFKTNEIIFITRMKAVGSW